MGTSHRTFDIDQRVRHRVEHYVELILMIVIEPLVTTVRNLERRERRNRVHLKLKSIANYELKFRARRRVACSEPSSLPTPTAAMVAINRLRWVVVKLNQSVDLLTSFPSHMLCPGEYLWATQLKILISWANPFGFDPNSRTPTAKLQPLKKPTTQQVSCPPVQL